MNGSFAKCKMCGEFKALNDQHACKACYGERTQVGGKALYDSAAVHYCEAMAFDSGALAVTDYMREQIRLYKGATVNATTLLSDIITAVERNEKHRNNAKADEVK